MVDFRFIEGGYVTGLMIRAIAVGLTGAALVLWTGCDGKAEDAAETAPEGVADERAAEGESPGAQPASEGTAGVAYDSELGAYDVGDPGPAGGHIAYVDEADEHPWTYIEAAPEETEWKDKPWGGFSTEVGEASQGQSLGSAAANTAAAVDFLGATEPYKDRDDYAAMLVAELEHNGFDDWQLPSIDELDLMYANLHEHGLGGFSGHDPYWSSSELNQFGAWSVAFSNGVRNQESKNARSVRVRAIRYF